MELSEKAGVLESHEQALIMTITSGEWIFLKKQECWEATSKR